MPYRLLLADDSLTIQKVVELTFPDPDYELLAVGNGEKAMDALDAFRPDIVLADVVMPGPPGYDICEAIRKRPGGAYVPVVLLTGTFEPFDRARADRVGATAVVTKPFDSHALAALVRDLLLKSAQERASAPAAAAAPEPAPAPAPEPEYDHGEDTMKLGDAPAPSWSPSRESVAADDLFGTEPAVPAIDAGRDDELYATTAIPVSRFASELAPPPEVVAPPPPPPPVMDSHHMEPLPIEEMAFTPPPPPPVEPAPWVAPPPLPSAEALPFDDEPLPPPPPFEPESAGAAGSAAAAWELAEERVTGSIWEVPPAAEAPQAEPVAPRGQEMTQPLPSTPEPIALEDELPPPPPFEASSELTEAIDVHSPSTPTTVITPPHAAPPPPLEEPPLYAREPEPPAEPAAAAPELALADTSHLLTAQRELAPAEPEAPSADEVFEAAPPAEESAAEPAAEPVAFGFVPPAVAPEREMPEFGHDEPVARDIDEDIAAFESSQTRRPREHVAEEEPAELEELAASANLTDLIPPATPAAPAAAEPLSDADVDRIARRVAELIGERVIRDISWEVVPEMAERLVRERLAAIEHE